MTDTYCTISTSAEGLYKEKGSKFLAYLWHVESENDVTNRLAEVKSMHPKARHHCYAYRLGHSGELWRANDDGEPSGTAGKPIHGQLIKHDLTQVLVVVVRYFGGTLLGAAGLIRAYRQATAEAISRADIIQCIIRQRYRLEFTYANMGQIMSSIERLQIPIAETDFADTPTVFLVLRLSTAADTLSQLRAELHGISVDGLADREDGPDWSLSLEEE